MIRIVSDTVALIGKRPLLFALSGRGHRISRSQRQSFSDLRSESEISLAKVLSRMIEGFGIVCMFGLTGCQESGSSTGVEPRYLNSPDIREPTDKLVALSALVVLHQTRVCAFGFIAPDLSKRLDPRADPGLGRFAPSIDFNRALAERGLPTQDVNRAARGINFDSVTGDRQAIALQYCMNDGKNIIVTLFVRIDQGRMKLDAAIRQGRSLASFTLDAANSPSPPLELDGTNPASIERAALRADLDQLSLAAGSKIMSNLKWEAFIPFTHPVTNRGIGGLTS